MVLVEAYRTTVASFLCADNRQHTVGLLYVGNIFIMSESNGIGSANEAEMIL